MSKEYKITFKTYANERLGLVTFGQRKVYPLYVQVTYRRQSIYFESYYFDLYSKQQYTNYLLSGNAVPTLEDVIQEEERVVKFVTDKHKDNFTLELFKKQYAFYCRDLLHIFEADFKQYLQVFFADEGFPFISRCIEAASKEVLAINIYEDLKTVLKDVLMRTLESNAVHYAPPYLPLYQFAHFLTGHRRSYPRLPVFNWLNPDTQLKFSAFMKGHPDYEVNSVLEAVDKYLSL